MQPNPELKAHTDDVVDGGEFKFLMIDSAVPEEREKIPQEYRDLVPESWPEL